jgi:nucleolar MIF4G domain-containing protein 1
MSSRLPESLRELVDGGRAGGKRKRQKEQPMSRREQRKAERKQKKRARREHQRQRQLIKQSASSSAAARSRTSLLAAAVAQRKKHAPPPARPPAPSEEMYASDASEESEEEPEDQEIDYLERKLGLRGSSGRGKKASAWKALSKEYERDGLGADFADFLQGLDGVMAGIREAKRGPKQPRRAPAAHADASGPPTSAAVAAPASASAAGPATRGSADEDGALAARGAASNESAVSGDEGGACSDEEELSEEELSEEELSVRPAARGRGDSLDSDELSEEWPEDQEIDYLERKLGLHGKDAAKNWKRLGKDYRKSGFDDDFSSFLQGLDGSILRQRTRYRPVPEARRTADGPEFEPETASESDDERREESLASCRRGAESLTGASDDERGDEDAEDAEDGPRGARADTAYMPSQSEADLYGRDVAPAEDAAAPSKYVPPHLRKRSPPASAPAASTAAAPASSAAAPAGLKRRITGLLNRLAESNVDPICGEIAGLYRLHSRRDTSAALTEAIIASSSLNVVINDVQAHCFAALASALHIRIGAEVGAHFLEEVARAFVDRLGDARQAVEDRGKALAVVRRAEGEAAEGEAASFSVAGSAPDLDALNRTAAQRTKQAGNLLMLIVCLYKFTVVTHKLVYGIVDELVGRFSEADVELLVVLLKHAGFALRKDDPAALVAAIRAVQAQTRERRADWDADAQQRCDFMLELVYKIKNNRVRRQDEALQERSKRLRRWVQRLKSRDDATLSRPELHISWGDLLDAQRGGGRWWIVGSPWQQKRAAERRAQGGAAAADTEAVSGRASGMDAEKEAKLMRLARAQRMSTDVRRRIFVAVMGSSDCLEAFERLLRLGLKPVQEREIVRVIVHCCGASRRYNPYFALLSARLCQHDHRAKFTFQLAFWDLFKLFSEGEAGGSPLSERRLLNLAQLLGHLVKCYALPISVLKALDFTGLESASGGRAMFFLRALFDFLFRTCDDDALRTVVRRVAAGKDSGMVTDALAVFLKLYMKIDKSDSMMRRKMRVARKALDEVSIVANASQARFNF